MADTAMTKADRTELRRITKARFEILQHQLREREVEVRDDLRDALETEHAAAVREANQRTASLQRKIDNLHEKIAQFRVQVEAEANSIVADGRDLQMDMAEKGIVPRSPNRYYRGNHPAIDCNMNHWGDADETFLSPCEGWEPSQLEQRIQKGYEEIAREAGLHKLDLRKKQLELEEELAIGALNSDSAREFLGKIPDIDNLLPANTEAVKKALTVTAVEESTEE